MEQLLLRSVILGWRDWRGGPNGGEKRLGDVSSAGSSAGGGRRTDRLAIADVATASG
jgi:hypothetical protein